MLVGVNICRCKERDEVFLECAEAAIHIAFSLWGRRKAVGDAKGSQCSLELAARIQGVLIRSQRASRINDIRVLSSMVSKTVRRCEASGMSVEAMRSENAEWEMDERR